MKARVPLAAQFYVGALTVAGAGVLWLTLATRASLSFLDAAIFGFLFLLTEAFPVVLPGGDGAYTVSFVVTLAAIVVGGPETAALASVSNLFNVRYLYRPNQIARRLFNTSSFVLCTGLAGLAYRWLGGPIGPALLHRPFTDALLPVLIATATHFALNTSLVAAMLALVRTADVRRGHPVRIWRREFAPLLGGYFAFAFLGLMLGILQIQVGRGALVLLLFPLMVARNAFQAAVKMEVAFEATVESLIDAIEAKDRYTRDHSGRVSRLSELVAREYGIRGRQLRVIRLAALMHDVGKLGVPTKVLAKPGKLTADEYDTMKIHPIRGHEIVSEIDFLKDAVSAVRHHHERMDGGGYPDGLRGEEIPVLARIIFVCDAFDAMTSTRIYRPAKDNESALAELRRCAGTQFDPDALAALERAVARHGWTGVPELAVWTQVEDRGTLADRAPTTSRVFEEHAARAADLAARVASQFFTSDEVLFIKLAVRGHHSEELANHPILDDHRARQIAILSDALDSLAGPWISPDSVSRAIAFLTTTSPSPFDQDLVAALATVVTDWNPHKLPRSHQEMRGDLESHSPGSDRQSLKTESGREAPGISLAELARKLRLARQARGLGSLQDAADFFKARGVGVSIQTLESLELGKTLPSTEVFSVYLDLFPDAGYWKDAFALPLQVAFDVDLERYGRRLPAGEEWSSFALCRFVHPGVFLAEESCSLPTAKQICSRCLVESNCLDYAMSVQASTGDTPEGIWGGNSFAERAAMIRARGRWMDVHRDDSSSQEP